MLFRSDALGKQLLTLFTVIPLSLLILGRAWEAAFDAIYGDPAHFADLRTRNDQGAPESPRELQSPEIMILSTFMNRFLKEIVRGWETSRELQKEGQVMTVKTDSDSAGCKRTRKSSSGGFYWWGAIA